MVRSRRRPTGTTLGTIGDVDLRHLRIEREHRRGAAAFRSRLDVEPAHALRDARLRTALAPTIHDRARRGASRPRGDALECQRLAEHARPVELPAVAVESQLAALLVAVELQRHAGQARETTMRRGAEADEPAATVNAGSRPARSRRTLARSDSTRPRGARPAKRSKRSGAKASASGQRRREVEAVASRVRAQTRDGLAGPAARDPRAAVAARRVPACARRPSTPKVQRSPSRRSRTSPSSAPIADLRGQRRRGALHQSPW